MIGKCPHFRGIPNLGLTLISFEGYKTCSEGDATVNPLTTQDELVTMVYHELRAPLGLMASAARSASEDCDDEWVRAQCDVIGRTAERMLRVVAGVIESARPDGSDIEARYAPLDIATRLLGDLEGVGIQVERDFDLGLRDTIAPGSQSKFETLLHSLLMSTIDHGRPGYPVTVRFSFDGEHFQLEVENFKRNVKVHRGLGLGARCCALLADQLGLEFRVEDVDADRYRALVSGVAAAA